MVRSMTARIFSSSKRPLVSLFILGLSIRLILMPVLTFELDLGYWLRISGMLDGGFTLYDTTGYYYTPIWGYIVALFSGLAHMLGISEMGVFVPELTPYTTGVFFISEYVVSPAYAVMMKVPIVLADIVTAFLLYYLVKDITKDERKAITAFGLWFLCPLIILLSSVHCMFDSISAMLIMLTIVFIHKREYFLGGSTFSLAVLTKFFPVFFLFFLIAYVLRREGIDRHGAKHLLVAVVGALITFIVVELPVIIRGQFWESLAFLTERVGLSTDVMYALTTPGMLLAMGFGIIVLTLVCMVVYRRKCPDLSDRLASMDRKDRDRTVVRGLLILAGIATLGVLVYSVVSFFGSSGTLMDMLTMLAMRFVMLFSIYTLIIEMYLAYRLLVADEFDVRTVFTTLMLSSLVMFLWPALPQYVVVIVPFLALYVVLVDDAFGRPLGRFVGVLTVYEVTVLNVGMLFTLAIYTNLVPLEPLIAITSAVSYVFMGIPVSMVILAILVVFEYIAMLGMFLAWYRNKEVSLHG